MLGGVQTEVYGLLPRVVLQRELSEGRLGEPQGHVQGAQGRVCEGRV